MYPNQTKTNQTQLGSVAATTTRARLTEELSRKASTEVRYLALAGQRMSVSLNDNEAQVVKGVYREVRTPVSRVYTLNHANYKEVIPTALQECGNIPFKLHAPTGCGKTTVIPSLISTIVGGKVLVAEPQWDYAYGAYNYVKSKLDSRVGFCDEGFTEGVGETVVYATATYILQQAIHNPHWFSQFSMLYIDEAHEMTAEYFALRVFAYDALKFMAKAFVSATFGEDDVETLGKAYSVSEHKIQDVPQQEWPVRDDGNQPWSPARIKDRTMIFCVDENMINHLGAWYESRGIPVALYHEMMQPDALLLAKKKLEMLKGYACVFLTTATSQTGHTFAVETVIDNCLRKVPSLNVTEGRISFVVRNVMLHEAIQRKGRLGRLSTGNYYAPDVEFTPYRELESHQKVHAYLWLKALGYQPMSEFDKVRDVMEPLTSLGCYQLLTTMIHPLVVRKYMDDEGKIFRNCVGAFEQFFPQGYKVIYSGDAIDSINMTNWYPLTIEGHYLEDGKDLRVAVPYNPQPEAVANTLKYIALRVATWKGLMRYGDYVTPVESNMNQTSPAITRTTWIRNEEPIPSFVSNTQPVRTVDSQAVRNSASNDTVRHAGGRYRGADTRSVKSVFSDESSERSEAFSELLKPVMNNFGLGETTENNQSRLNRRSLSQQRVFDHTQNPGNYATHSALVQSDRNEDMANALAKAISQMSTVLSGIDARLGTLERQRPSRLTNAGSTPFNHAYGQVPESTQNARFSTASRSSGERTSRASTSRLRVKEVEDVSKVPIGTLLADAIDEDIIDFMYVTEEDEIVIRALLKGKTFIHTRNKPDRHDLFIRFIKCWNARNSEYQQVMAELGETRAAKARARSLLKPYYRSQVKHLNDVKLQLESRIEAMRRYYINFDNLGYTAVKMLDIEYHKMEPHSSSEHSSNLLGTAHEDDRTLLPVDTIVTVPVMRALSKKLWDALQKFIDFSPKIGVISSVDTGGLVAQAIRLQSEEYEDVIHTCAHLFCDDGRPDEQLSFVDENYCEFFLPLSCDPTVDSAFMYSDLDSLPGFETRRARNNELCYTVFYSPWTFDLSRLKDTFTLQELYAYTNRLFELDLPDELSVSLRTLLRTLEYKFPTVYGQCSGANFSTEELNSFRYKFWMHHKLTVMGPFEVKVTETTNRCVYHRVTLPGMSGAAIIAASDGKLVGYHQGASTITENMSFMQTFY